MTMPHTRIGLALILWLGTAAVASASGHGPVFGAATPTLGRLGADGAGLPTTTSVSRC